MSRYGAAPPPPPSVYGAPPMPPGPAQPPRPPAAAPPPGALPSPAPRPPSAGPMPSGRPAPPPPLRTGVGIGQLALRVAQFNEDIARRPSQNSIEFWRAFVAEYFHSTALYKYIVWLARDTRTFQISRDALPRLFFSIFSSGISGIRLLLENPREYALDQKTFLLFSSRTRTYYNYTNGCKVIMGGSLRVTFSHHLKVLLWEYEVQKYEEFLPKSIIMHAAYGIDCSGKRTYHDPHHRNPNDLAAAPVDFLPTSGINEFGLPPSVMRCFEITEVINYMKDLMDDCTEKNISPLEALHTFHRRAPGPAPLTTAPMASPYPVPPANAPSPYPMGYNTPGGNPRTPMMPPDMYSYSSAPQTPATPQTREQGANIFGDESDDYDPMRDPQSSATAKKRTKRSSSKTSETKQPATKKHKPNNNGGNNSQGPSPASTPLPYLPLNVNYQGGGGGGGGGYGDMGDEHAYY